MNRISNLQDFLDQVRSLCARKASCTVVFFYGGDTWGKIGIHQGGIHSVRCRALNGVEALPLIAKATEIQHNVRPEQAEGKERERNISSQEFFAFFGDLPEAKEKPAIVPAASNRPTPRTLAESAVRGAAVPHKKKILVTEDSRVARKYIAKVLLGAGYAVLEAENGFEALGQLSNESPDLLILDLILPGIDGYRVLESVRKNPQFAKLPVFILTSRDSLLDKLKGRMSDSDEYLTKPVDGALLLEKIARYLN